MSESQGRKQTAEERKAARARRVIEKKNAAIGGGPTTVKKAETVEEHMISKEQIQNSRNIVDAAKYDGEQLISDVQVDRNDSENKRRRKEEHLKQERYERIEQELREAQKVNQEIEEAWPEVAKKSIPQELYSCISAQYKKASHLLGVKDELIKFLQTTLKNKDEDYVEVLSQHQEDINNLLKRMKDTFEGFVKTVSKELSEIEETFLKERQELLDKNHEEIEYLFEKRRKMEVVIMESKQAREKKCAQELLEIRNRDAEDYNSLKIDLENSIQIFEQQLEEMRATYQLNSEKLEYNHSVLIERDLENKATVEHHRQRLRKLKENLSALIQRFHKQDTRFKSENRILTEDYKRMTEQFKDLQKKYAHFVNVDTKKYADVWSMNEEHVMELVRKVMKASQIIHEQILGLDWKPTLLKSDLAKVMTGMQFGGPSYVDVNAITSAMIFQAGHAQQQQLQQQQQQHQQQPSNANSVGGGGGEFGLASPKGGDSAAAAAAAASAAASATGSKFSPAQIKTVMDLLANEINFLLDSRIQETVQALAERAASGILTTPAELEREQEMYRADGILSAIGVEDREDLDSLVSIFYDGAESSSSSSSSSTTNPVGSSSSSSGTVGGSSSSSSSSSNSNGLISPDAKPTVHPNDVARVIGEFVVKRQQVKTKAGVGVTGGLSSAAASSLSSSKGQHDSVLSEKKARRKERERLFWYRLGHVISEQTLGVWTALERWQHQYNTLLEERATLIDETTELAKQNEELKILLSGYLGSSVNKELEIPPTRLIRVNQQ